MCISQARFLWAITSPSILYPQFCISIVVKALIPAPDLHIHLLTGPSLQLTLKTELSPNTLSSMVSLSPPSPSHPGQPSAHPSTHFLLSSLLPWCPLISTILCNEHSQLPSSFPFSPSSNPPFTMLVLSIHDTV